MSYSIGIDYGTASGRVFLINTTNGQVVSKFVKPYTHGVIESELNGLKYHIHMHFKIVMII